MEIDTSRYYWKNSLITLRRPKAEDWEHLIHHMFDSQGRFFFNEKIDLPVDVEQYKGRPEFIIRSSCPISALPLKTARASMLESRTFSMSTSGTVRLAPLGL